MRNRDNWKPTKYVYRNGRLVASSDRKEVGFGSRLVTNLIAEFYDSNLRNNAKGKLLDLGCGNVPLFMAYKDFVSDNVCVDWGNTVHKNEYLDFECDLTQTLPFADGEFDTIILSDVLEHVPTPENLWREISRLLAVDGKIIMNVPFYYWLHEQPHDYYRYTEFALRRFVDGAGLKLLQCEPIGGAPEIVADIFAKNVIRVPMFGYSIAKFSQWMALTFIKTKLGRKISEGTRDSFPFGYFLVAVKQPK